MFEWLEFKIDTHKFMFLSFKLRCEDEFQPVSQPDSPRVRTRLN